MEGLDVQAMLETMRGFMTNEAEAKSIEDAPEHQREGFGADLKRGHEIADHLIRALIDENSIKPITPKELAIAMFGFNHTVLASSTEAPTLLALSEVYKANQKHAARSYNLVVLANIFGFEVPKQPPPR